MSPWKTYFLLICSSLFRGHSLVFGSVIRQQRNQPEEMEFRLIFACLQAMSKPTPQQERVALRRSLYVPRDRFLFGGVLEKDQNKIWLPDNFWIWNQQGSLYIFVMIKLGVSWRLTINCFLILKAHSICFTSVLMVGGPCTKAPANARRSIELLEFSWVGLWKTARWRV